MLGRRGRIGVLFPFTEATMSSLSKRSAALVLLALASAPAAWAKDDPVEFARRLARRRYFDLAQEVVDLLEKDTRASAADKEAIPFARAEVLLEQAQAETDLKKALEVIDGSVGLLKKFLKDRPNHPLANDAQINVGWLQNQKAKRLSLALRNEENPARRDEHLRGARQTYAEVEAYYRDLINVLKAKDLEKPENGYPYMDAVIELGRTQLEHAKLPGLDGDERGRTLEDARKMLSEFLFEWGQTGKSFEAMWVMGQIYGEQGTLDRAESHLRQASAGLFQKLKEGGREQDEYYLGVVRGASLSLAQLLNRAGKQKEAVAAIDEAFARDKGLERDGMGYQLKLEKAQALFDSGNAVEAKKLNTQVLKADPEGYFGYLAREQAKRWTSGPRARSTAEDLMNAAEASIDKEQWIAALQSLRRCVELAVTNDDKEKHHPAAYYKMGNCWLKLNRPYEAAFAFENVYRGFPKNPLSPQACYESIRCYANEYNVSGDKRDEDAKDQISTVLRQNWPNHPAARNIAYLQAEKIEKQAQKSEKPEDKAKLYRQAAELYLQVREDAEAYENALISAGYCYYREALAKWTLDSKSDASKAEVRSRLLESEKAFKKFLARLDDPKVAAPAEPELKKRREDLRFTAYRQLANIYKHDAVSRSEDCLKFLDDCAKTLPPQDERLARILGDKVPPLLALKRPTAAIQVVDMMFEKFQDSPALPPAAKSVGIALDNATEELIKQKKEGDPAVRENMKKISQYYLKWVTDGPTAGMKITVQEVAQVADRLYLYAKRMNGLGDTVVSFLDLKGRMLKERRPFQEAAFVHALLVEGKMGRLPEKEQIELMTRLARCYSFIANNAQDWLKAKAQYKEIVDTFKLEANNRLNVQVLQQHPELLHIYAELGHSFCELGRNGQKFQFDNAMTVFGNVISGTQPMSEPWWFGKYMMLAILFERGQQQDITTARIGLDNLEKNYPGYDEGKFGMKERFLGLKQKLGAVTGGK